MLFQQFATQRALNAPYPRPVFFALGLAGEAGEVADKIKKGWRGDYDLDNLDPERRRAIGLELGDVLWYLANLAYEIGYTMDDIEAMNVEKLESRDRRGTTRGDGDHR